jgi:uncharacterized membrane protein (UPF0127 family)
MKSKIFIFVGLLVVIAAFVIYFNHREPSLTVSGKHISLIIADTQEEREKGLGGMESLPENSAMLFTFQNEDIYNIWMKDMKFPIDIIWLNSSKKIVAIEENISPDTYPEIFSPGEKSLYVLETNAGFVEKNNLLTGNTLDFSL